MILDTRKRKPRGAPLISGAEIAREFEISLGLFCNLMAGDKLRPKPAREKTRNAPAYYCQTEIRTWLAKKLGREVKA